jgi:hypothetical protein
MGKEMWNDSRRSKKSREHGEIREPRGNRRLAIWLRFGDDTLVFLLLAV